MTDDATSALKCLQNEVQTAKRLQDKFNTGGEEAEAVHAEVKEVEQQFHSLILRHLCGALLDAMYTAFGKIRSECLVPASLPTVLEPLAAFEFGDDFSALCTIVQGEVLKQLEAAAPRVQAARSVCVAAVNQSCETAAVQSALSVNFADWKTWWGFTDGHVEKENWETVLDFIADKVAATARQQECTQ